MHHLVDSDAIDEMLNDLHAAVVKATGRSITAASWSKATKHFKAGLAAALAPPRVAAPVKKARKKAAPGATKGSSPTGSGARPARASGLGPSATAAAGPSASVPSAPSAPRTKPAAPVGTRIVAVPAAASTEDDVLNLDQATETLRTALRKVDRATRWVVLHATIWRSGYVGSEVENEELDAAVNDREIEYNDSYDGWTPREEHRKVCQAIAAARAWRTALEECEPDAAEDFLAEHDLNELDAQSYDSWRKLDFV